MPPNKSSDCKINGSTLSAELLRLYQSNVQAMLMKMTHPSNAKITAALRVDGAGLEEGLAGRCPLASGGGKSDGSEGHDGDNSGFEELHVERVKVDWVE